MIVRDWQEGVGDFLALEPRLGKRRFLGESEDVSDAEVG